MKMTQVDELREKLLDYFASGAPSYKIANQSIKANARIEVDALMPLIDQYVERVALEARLDERQMLNFHRAYGKDYQATLETLEEANDDRIAELKAQQEEV